MVLKNQRPDFDIYNCGSPKIEKIKIKIKLSGQKNCQFFCGSLYENCILFYFLTLQKPKTTVL